MEYGCGLQVCQSRQSDAGEYLSVPGCERVEERDVGLRGLNGLPAGLGSNTNIYQNRAYSKLTNQLNAETEFAIAKKAVAARPDTSGRNWTAVAPASWINCADARTTNENTIGGEWRRTAVGNLSGRLSYAYSMRRGTYNENAFLALVPMANQIPAGGATTERLRYLKQTGLTDSARLRDCRALR